MTENAKPRTWRRPNDHRHIELGMTVRDRLTGMEGIAASRVEYLTGCTQYAVSQPGLTSEGKAKPWDYFDWQRLEYAADAPNEWADVRTSEATRLANGAGEAPQGKI